MGKLFKLLMSGMGHQRPKLPQGKTDNRQRGKATCRRVTN